jgi:hypothetical protein
MPFAIRALSVRDDLSLKSNWLMSTPPNALVDMMLLK